MSTKWLVAWIGCALGLSIGSAYADVSVTLRIPAGTPAQLQTGANASVGLIVDGNANTAYNFLTVGAGYTLTCQGGTNNPRQDSRVVAFSNPGFVTQTVDKSSTFAIAGFNGWQIGVDHQCDVSYLGRVAGGATAAGSQGNGASFTFTGSGLVPTADTETRSFNMRRFGTGGGGGGGCTPNFNCCTL